jgi:hypothetical protein
MGRGNRKTAGAVPKKGLTTVIQARKARAMLHAPQSQRFFMDSLRAVMAIFDGIPEVPVIVAGRGVNASINVISDRYPYETEHYVTFLISSFTDKRIFEMNAMNVCSKLCNSSSGFDELSPNPDNPQIITSVGQLKTLHVKWQIGAIWNGTSEKHVFTSWEINEEYGLLLNLFQIKDRIDRKVTSDGGWVKLSEKRRQEIVDRAQKYSLPINKAIEWLTSSKTRPIILEPGEIIDLTMQPAMDSKPLAQSLFGAR